MSESFKSRANWAHEKLFRVASDKLKNNTGKLADAIADTARAASRTVAPLANVGVGITSGGMALLSWMATKGLIDNKFIDWLESQMAKRGKQKPYLSALMRYYAMLAMAAGVTFGAGHLINDDTNDYSDQLVVSYEMFETLNKNLKICPTNDYREFVAQCKPMTPFLVGFLSCPEGFRADVYKDGRGIPTIGYGSTITPDGKVTMKTPSVNKSQAYEYARWHLEDYETDFIIYCYCVAFNKELTANEYLGLASFLYNGGANMFEPDSDKKSNRIRNDRWTLMIRDFRETGNISRDQVLQYFNDYPIQSEGSVCEAWRTGANLDVVGHNMTNYLSGGRGLHWRRWIEACILTGRISPVDLLDCPVGGIYEFQQYMKNAHKIDLIDRDTRTVNYDAANIFLEWLQHKQYWDKKHKRLYTPPEKQITIRSILPSDIVAQCENMEFDQKGTDDKIAVFDFASKNLRKKGKVHEIAMRNTVENLNAYGE